MDPRAQGLGVRIAGVVDQVEGFAGDFALQEAGRAGGGDAVEGLEVGGEGQDLGYEGLEACAFVVGGVHEGGH